jgi:DNA-binding response OmpR family regulator
MIGIEFLKKRSRDDAMKRIPVVVLPSSREEQDKVQRISLGVSDYMLEPVGYEQFVETIGVLDSYWALSPFPPGNL